MKSRFLILVILFTVAMQFNGFATNQTTVKRTGKGVVTAKSSQNSFATPDFAFPVDVKKNALAELNDAMKSKNYVKALQALIQIDIARVAVSEDSVTSNIEMFENTADRMAAPYSQLARLLEAQLFLNIYKKNRYIYDNRVLPSDKLISDPREWGKKQFEEKIYDLLKESVKEPETAQKTALSELEPVLVEYNQQMCEGLSVADFISFRINAIANGLKGHYSDGVLPFGDSKTAVLSTINKIEALNEDVINKRVDYYKKQKFGLPYINMLLLKASNCNREEKTVLLTPLLHENLSLLEGAVLYDYLYNHCFSMQSSLDSCMIDSTRKFYEQLKSFVDRFNDQNTSADDKNYLKILNGVLSELTVRKASVKVDDAVVPNKEIDVAVKITNMPKTYVMLFNIDRLDRKKYWIDYKTFASRARLIQTIEIDNSGKELFDTTQNVRFKGVAAGNYAIIVSKNGEIDGIVRNGAGEVHLTALNVSDVSFVVSNRSGKTPTTVVYLVNSRTQQPISNVELTFDGWDYSSGKNTKVVRTLRTDSSGACVSLLNHGQVSVKYKGSYAETWVGSGSKDGNEKKTEYLTILPSLSLYHPGDTVQYAVIAYEKFDNRLSLTANREVEIAFFNANDRQIGSQKLISDEYGRCNGEFVIPENDLLGSYSLVATTKSLTNSKVNTAYRCEFVEVAEYKAPSFRVVLNPVVVADDNNSITLGGNVTTYSGMPLPDSNVSIKIERSQRFWWLPANGKASFGCDVTTDSNGEFKVVLPLEELKKSVYKNDVFSVSSVATSPAGEMQSSSIVLFNICNGYAIVGNIPELIELDEEKTFDVKVVDLIGNPIQKTVDYKIYDLTADNKEVAQGEFLSPELRITPAMLGSGKYRIDFSLANDTLLTPCDKEFVVYHQSDVKPPYETPLWVPKTEFVAGQSDRSVSVTVGTSYNPSWILCEISDSKHLLSSKWIKCNGENVNVDVPVPADNERIYVSFSGMHDLEGKTAHVVVLPAESQRELKGEIVTFRDKISAGGKEKWEFRFKVDNQPATKLAAMAVMSDDALNSIRPFSWRFSPNDVLNWNDAVRLYVNSIGNVSELYWFTRSVGYSHLPLVSSDVNWNLYRMSLFGNRYYGIDNVKIRGYRTSAVKSAAPTFKMQSDEEVNVESAVMMDSVQVYETSAEAVLTGGVSEADEDAGSGGGDDDVEMRESECPLAFFMPDLKGDDDGNIVIDFEAPDFNTTWNLQLIGYTPDLLNCKLDLKAVASKPVMVQPSQPRFARVGDKVELSATLFNNTSELQSIYGVIEIFNPLTGEIVQSFSSAAESVRPSASKVITLDFTTPQNYPELGIRMIAKGERGSDGEQSTIVVLPASSPVVESTTFYLKDGAGEYVQTLPTFDKNATVTLQYCDNPVWYCVTALPGISYSESENLISMLYALFGNVMATGLVSDYPQIKDALKYWQSEIQANGTNTLVSKLSQDDELKIVQLNATPFVKSAESETLRMMGLQILLDSAYNKKTVSDLIGRISKLQNSDGGWSWCSGFKSSVFMTQEALAQFAVLNSFNYLKDYESTVGMMLKRGVAYCDSEIVKDYNRDRKNFNYSGLANYLYIRSALGDMPCSETFSGIRSKALNEIEKSWKKFGIYEKSQTAILLWRHGMKKTALEILESLRQYATHSDTRGVWFDNLSSGYNGWAKLRDTSRALEAFALISPEDEMVNGIRQWLVLQRQTENWGDNRFTSEVISAIMLSGSQWTDVSAMSKITLNGEEITLSPADKYVGEIKMNLNPGQASGAELKIEKSSAGPSWGGVVAQYYKPVTEIEEASVNLMSLVKDVYVVRTTQQGTKAVAVESSKGVYNLKKGDCIRVVLTLSTKQDMNYVAITDERAACFEPVEQLSGIEWNDGMAVYRETLDTQTNMFFNFLPKGKHVVSYDCYVTRDGEYALGIATAQSQYSPMITAHSAGKLIRSK